MSLWRVIDSIDQLTPDAPHTSPFDTIKHKEEDDSKYWSVRELGKLLGYTEYRKFKNAIQKAEIACKTSGQAISDHFAHVSGMVDTTYSSMCILIL